MNVGVVIAYFDVVFFSICTQSAVLESTKSHIIWHNGQKPSFVINVELVLLHIDLDDYLDDLLSIVKLHLLLSIVLIAV